MHEIRNSNSRLCLVFRAIIRVERIRREVYADQSLLANIKNWWGGLSRSIRFLEDELNNLRARLAASSTSTLISYRCVLILLRSGIRKNGKPEHRKA